jgi:ubiquinone/menaquinone biosynthesis C-methylase UbiE
MSEKSEIKRNLAAFYDGDARHYHEMHYIVESDYTPLKQRQKYIEAMIATLALPAGARILDVGCGPGQLLLPLLRRGFDAKGIDISAGMVEQARELIRSNGIRDFRGVAVGDIERLDFGDEEFDVVVASGVIEYQKSDDVALAEMKRVLRPNGHLILNVTNKYSYLTVSDNIYIAVRSLPGVRAVVGALRRQLRGDGHITDVPPHRVHSPGQFDRKLAEHGFTKQTHNFFRFSPLPTPLSSLCPGWCSAVGKRMERFSRTPLGYIGGGYLVMARKGSSPARS